MLKKTKTERWPQDVVSAAVNLGGANVEVHTLDFTTRYDSQGRYVGDEIEVNGFNWRCLGCDKRGGDRYLKSGYHGLDDAQEAAQKHAERCRFVSRPAASAGQRG